MFAYRGQHIDHAAGIEAGVLTGRGRTVVDAALEDLLRSERVLLTGLDRGQRRELAALLRILLAPFDATQAPETRGA